MEFDAIIEEQVDSWSEGSGFVQIVEPDEEDRLEFLFCYKEDGERQTPHLSVDPNRGGHVAEAVEMLAPLAEELTPDELRGLVDTLGEEKVKSLMRRRR